MIRFDREAMEFEGLDEKTYAQLKKTYPNADVPHELEKMKLWLLTAKGKARKGNLQFISSWLSRVRQPIPVAVFENGNMVALKHDIETIQARNQWLHALNTKA